jgi:hypothetical protein
MICAVLKLKLGEVPLAGQTPHVWYFTLEKGRRISGGDRTVLCAWDKASHINYGDGPAASPAEFVEAVTRLVAPELRA